MKALDLVRKVTALRASFRRPERDGRAAKDGLRARAAVSVLRVTTAVARQMQHLPIPRPSAAERGAIAMAAAPLRALAAEVPPVEEGSPEAALVELVHETLALVDKLLEAEPELAPKEPPRKELPEPGGDPTRHKVRF